MESNKLVFGSAALSRQLASSNPVEQQSSSGRNPDSNISFFWKSTSPAAGAFLQTKTTSEPFRGISAGNELQLNGTSFGNQEPKAAHEIETIGTHISFVCKTGTDVIYNNGSEKSINTRLQFITGMKEYENKSFEELRLEDYMLNRKGSRSINFRNDSDKTNHIKATSALPIRNDNPTWPTTTNTVATKAAVADKETEVTSFPKNGESNNVSNDAKLMIHNLFVQMQRTHIGTPRAFQFQGTFSINDPLPASWTARHPRGPFRHVINLQYDKDFVLIVVDLKAETIFSIDTSGNEVSPFVSRNFGHFVCSLLQLFSLETFVVLHGYVSQKLTLELRTARALMFVERLLVGNYFETCRDVMTYRNDVLVRLRGSPEDVATGRLAVVRHFGCEAFED